jgi:Flp pilus assembly protein TadG
MALPFARNRKGFTLLAAVACAAIIFGATGLAVDIGRLYITKTEAQAFADSAALYAAQQLDSTSSGINQAQSAVANSVQRWNFGQTSFSGTTVEFSTNGVTNWRLRADVPSGDVAYIRYVRVTPTVANMRLLFLPVITAIYPASIPEYATVNAQAVAGQVIKSTFSGGGIFPFSPIAHAYGNTAAEVYENDPTGNFGFTVGEQYTLRWPSNPNDVNFNNVCSGDATDDWLTKADAHSNEQRGYIQYQDASTIRKAIEGDYMDYEITMNVQLNMSVDPTNGAKSTEADALMNRINQDGDTVSETYADYIANSYHNGRRLVTVVVNNGYRDAAGNLLPADEQAIAVGFAQFLLLPASEYQHAGNKEWCAIYVGNSPLMGSDNTGGVGNNGQGVSYVRLSQ